ncbi:MAG TPA: Rieske 2Fe-2S domain-containing protein [Planctomycetaceae bacterium]|nr:Rieske 2Fe-2S domain-containing protein [Planctomycetaceae bacterium]
MTGNSPLTPAKQTSPESSDNRRGFIKFLSVVIGGAITAVPAVLGTIFFLDPILRKRNVAAGEGSEGSPGEGFTRVGTLESLPDNGHPVFQQIKMDVVDAWNIYKDQPVGSVYVRRDEAGNVTCFNTECPHLGCTVDYNESKNAYICPCHDSSFKITGEKTNDIPPRPMDALEVKVTEEGDVWVKFESFKVGVPEDQKR